MRIDDKRILKEIRELEKRQFRIKSVTDYLYTQSDIEMMTLIYKKLTGKNPNFFVSRNPYYSQKSKYSIMLRGGITLYDYFATQDECTEIADIMLKTYDDTGYIDYWMDDSQRRLSKKDFLEILRDFLSSFDVRLYRQFEDALEQKVIDMDTDKSMDAHETYPNYLNGNHMILVDCKRNISGIGTMVHELGHFYQFNELSRRSKKQLFYFPISFYEMYSIYLEIALLDYLKENHILMRDTLISENEFYTYYYDHMAGLYDCSNFNSDECDEDILQLIENSYIYSFGFLLSLILHERSLDDPKDVRKRIDNFIFSEGLLPKGEQLKVLGITANDLKDEKVLVKRLETHNENMKKYVVRQKI